MCSVSLINRPSDLPTERQEIKRWNDLVMRGYARCRSPKGLREAQLGLVVWDIVGIGVAGLIFGCFQLV